MNTPKSQAQQAIEAVRRLVERGALSAADGEKRIASIRLEQQDKAYRAMLDAAARYGLEPDAPPLRRVPAEALDPVGHGRHIAHLRLTGGLNTVGVLVAEMDRHFHLSDVSDPEPHPAGVQVDATIAPHFYLAVHPAEGGLK